MADQGFIPYPLPPASAISSAIDTSRLKDFHFDPSDDEMQEVDDFSDCYPTRIDTQDTRNLDTAFDEHIHNRPGYDPAGARIITTEASVGQNAPQSDEVENSSVYRDAEDAAHPAQPAATNASIYLATLQAISRAPEAGSAPSYEQFSLSNPDHLYNSDTDSNGTTSDEEDVRDARNYETLHERPASDLDEVTRNQITHCAMVLAAEIFTLMPRNIKIKDAGVFKVDPDRHGVTNPQELAFLEKQFKSRVVYLAEAQNRMAERTRRREARVKAKAEAAKGIAGKIAPKVSNPTKPVKAKPHPVSFVLPMRGAPGSNGGSVGVAAKAGGSGAFSLPVRRKLEDKAKNGNR